MSLSSDTKVIDEIKLRLPKPQHFTAEFEQYIRDRMKDDEVISFVSPAQIREDKNPGLGVEDVIEVRMKIQRGFVILTNQNLYTLAPKMCAVYRKQNLPDYCQDEEATRRLTGFIFPRSAVGVTLRIFIRKGDSGAFLSKIESMGIAEKFELVHLIAPVEHAN